MTKFPSRILIKPKKIVIRPKNTNKNLSINKNNIEKSTGNAVVIIGFPEYVEYVFDSMYENVIKPNHAKCFAHIWISKYEFKIEKIKKLFNSIGGNLKIDQQNKNNYETSFVNSRYYKRKEGEEDGYWHPPNVFGQFDSASRVMNMVKKYEKENKEFDYILKTRCDIHYNSKIIIEDIKKQNYQICANKHVHPWYIVDFIFYGTSNAMHCWGESFTRIEKLYKKHGAAFLPESLWYKNWEINGCKIMYKDLNKHYHLAKRNSICNFCKSIPLEKKLYNN